jgi:hypothetical protein
MLLLLWVTIFDGLGSLRYTPSRASGGHLEQFQPAVKKPGKGKLSLDVMKQGRIKIRPYDNIHYSFDFKFSILNLHSTYFDSCFWFGCFVGF